jgi:hypothetical protein
MKHQRLLWLVLLVAILATPSLYAQTPVTTGPVTTAMSLSWASPNNVPTLTEVQAIEWRLRDNNGAFLVVPGTTCTGTAAPFACTSKLTTAMAAMLNTLGTHNITLTAYLGGTAQVESLQSAPFALKSPAGAPTGLRITP